MAFSIDVKNPQTVSATEKMCGRRTFARVRLLGNESKIRVQDKRKSQAFDRRSADRKCTTDRASAGRFTRHGLAGSSARIWTPQQRYLVQYTSIYARCDGCPRSTTLDTCARLYRSFLNPTGIIASSVISNPAYRTRLALAQTNESGVGTHAQSTSHTPLPPLSDKPL